MNEFAKLTWNGVFDGNKKGYVLNIPKAHRDDAENFIGEYNIAKTISTGDYMEFILHKIQK